MFVDLISHCCDDSVTFSYLCDSCGEKCKIQPKEKPMQETNPPSDRLSEAQKMSPQEIEKLTRKPRPFDLERAKAGDPVCTRDGCPVRIICFDTKGVFNQPIIALIDRSDFEEVIRCYENGTEDIDRNDTVYDLFMAPKKITGWINIFRYGQSLQPSNVIYDTEIEAENAKRGIPAVLATIAISFEV
jgi:hypothetical protein